MISDKGMLILFLISIYVMEAFIKLDWKDIVELHESIFLGFLLVRIH
jgi:hypothetical protein